MDEAKLIRERYSRRHSIDRYSFLNPDVYLKFQERERKLIELFKRIGKTDFSNLKVLEVGCGSGNNLVELILLGFSPHNIAGIELLEERFDAARKRLPTQVNLFLGNALDKNNLQEKYDIVYQSTVFSSILDDKFQAELAARMLDWMKSDGGILWYDFIYNNPRNKDVRGINLKRIKELYPGYDIIKNKITLAPPIARRITKFHPSLYYIFNLIYPLRTHLLCWLYKK